MNLPQRMLSLCVPVVYASVLSVIAFGSVPSGFAAIDPCRLEENAVKAAERNVEKRQRFVESQQDRLMRTQDQVANQTANYEMQIANAQARAAMIRANASIYGSNCVSGNLISISRCLIQASARRNAANRQADAIVVAAIRRYNNYLQIGQQQIARQAQRVEDAKVQRDQAAAVYAVSVTALNQCIARNSRAT
jgi:hypothetical protein